MLGTWLADGNRCAAIRVYVTFVRQRGVSKYNWHVCSTVKHTSGGNGKRNVLVAYGGNEVADVIAVGFVSIAVE